MVLWSFALTPATNCGVLARVQLEFETLPSLVNCFGWRATVRKGFALIFAMSVDPKTGKVIPVAITVAGMMDDPSYQRCKRLAEELSQLNRHTTYNCVPLVETDWQRYLQVKQTVR